MTYFRSLMMASFLGQTQTIVELVNNIKIHPDIADCLGNSAVMYATVSTIMSLKY